MKSPKPTARPRLGSQWPAVNEQEWFKSLGSEWTSNGRAALVREAKYGVEMLHVKWTDRGKSSLVEVISRIATRDRAIDFAKPGRSVPLSPAERELNTRGTELIPVHGIVKQTSDKIVGDANARSDIEKARAIYEWIVDNTFRDAKVRGCGIGDIATMLSTGDLGGAANARLDCLDPDNFKYTITVKELTAA